jgi:hypothetical protein
MGISSGKKQTKAPSILIDSKELAVSGRVLKIARIAEEWYEDVDDPQGLVNEIRNRKVKADIFTFWQRLPDTVPKFPYYMEWEYIAVLQVASFDHWWKNQIKSQTRRLIKNAKKQGIVIREAEFDEKFVGGMTQIFNETRIRQGKPFWHYGKDFETVKREFSRYLFREELIGAYLEDELVGFIMLAHTGRYALPGQIISKTNHRDKSINNALIAKAVEICERKGIPFLVYYYWGRGGLAEFKRRNGFQKTALPRYYIPITLKGKLVIMLKLHRTMSEILPERVFKRLSNLRSRYYSFKYGDGL